MSQIISLTGLPEQLVEEQVRALLATFGNLASFQLLSGRAVFKLSDAKLTEAVVLALNGLAVAGKTCKCTCIDESVAAALGQPANQPSSPAAAGGAALGASAVILEIHNLASEAELQQESEWSAIKADVTQECSELGDVQVVEMPRVGEHGAGNAYVVFKERVDAERTKRALHGRKFGGRVVACCFSGEETEPEADAQADAAEAAPAPAPSLESSRWADDVDDNAGEEGAAAADPAGEGDAAAQSAGKRAADGDAGEEGAAAADPAGEGDAAAQSAGKRAADDDAGEEGAAKVARVEE